MANEANSSELSLRKALGVFDGIAILVIISATRSINWTMMTATRDYYAMSRDGLFFKWLDRVYPRLRMNDDVQL